MSIVRTTKRIRDALLETGVDLYHYNASKPTAAYAVWAEDGETTAGYGDNGKTEQTISGTVDYYTREEFDPMTDRIQEALNRLNGYGCTWSLDQVLFEEETNWIRFTWSWEVSGCLV